MSIAIQILSMSSRLEHFITVILKKSNLTLPQFNALCVLASHHPDAIPLNKLTSGMIDKSSNTSRLVDKLVDKNLVQRELVPLDRRVIHISITETGIKVAYEAAELLELGLEKQIIPSDNTEMYQLIENLKILRGYRDNIEK